MLKGLAGCTTFCQLRIEYLITTALSK